MSRGVAEVVLNKIHFLGISQRYTASAGRSAVIPIGRQKHIKQRHTDEFPTLVSTSN